MSEFAPFAALIKNQFDEMAKGELYIVGNDNQFVWDMYLASYPEGTNEIYRVRSENDCACCRKFVKNVGNVVSIGTDGSVTTVWDVVGAEEPYATVAANMAAVIREMKISSVYRMSEKKYGEEINYERLSDGTTQSWNHFYAVLPQKFLAESIAAARAEFNVGASMLRDGLKIMSIDALDTVIDLIQSDALYRGAEKLPVVTAFAALYRAHAKLKTDAARNQFVWLNATAFGAKFKNDVAGTLVEALSSGEDLEVAVAKFESKVDATNYKRTTALITPGMAKAAYKTIQELGLESALHRRHAKLSDVSVNNVLWVDNTVQGKMKDGIEGLLMSVATAPKVTNPEKAETISVEDFLTNVLPQASSMEVLVTGGMQGNMMSVTAPIDPTSAPLFKWDNNFAWSYNGNVTDSIKERVKKAGGSIVGDLCCRLVWDYTDDLDFHMTEPGGYKIWFRTIRQKSPSGGMLDIDANGMDGMKDHPAENIFYADRNKMKEGTYRLEVNNFNRRSANGVGFAVQVEFDGKTIDMTYDRVVPGSTTMHVADITYSKKAGFAISPMIPSRASSVDKWGIKTETFVKVNTLMNSPNHWDGNAVVQKHWFFILDGCVNDEPTRGIYNEFLRPELDKHRKAFEMLGNETKCQPADEQLSGVGFASAKGDSVLVNVTGTKLRKTYKITF
jgi:hypothetical protein